MSSYIDDLTYRVLLDGYGQVYPVRKTLKFSGSHLIDDQLNDQTIVQITSAGGQNLAVTLNNGNSAYDRIANLYDPVNNQDATTKIYVDNLVGSIGLDDVLSVTNNTGGRSINMTGGSYIYSSDGSVIINDTLNMNGNIINNVGTPSVSTDAVNKSYVDGYIQNVTLAKVLANGNVATGNNIVMAGNKITEVGNPTDNYDAVNKLYVDSKTWDHGGLLGLGDDDHTQYLLINGTRAMTGSLNSGNYTITNVATPVNSTDAVNKLYVDGYHYDHGGLIGLSDDDHTQYLLVNGTRAMTGALNMNTYKVTSVGLCTESGDAANKGYVDGYVGSKLSSLSVIAGNGLTGGGTLSSSVTLNVAAADTSITVNADSIKVGVISDTNHGSRSGGSLHAVATSSVAGFMSAADKTKLDNSKDWTGILSNGSADAWIHLVTLPVSGSGTLDGTRIEIIGGPWTSKPVYAYVYMTNRGGFSAKVVSGSGFELSTIRVQVYTNVDSTVSVYGYLTSTYKRAVFNVSSQYYWAIGGLVELLTAPTGTLIWDSYTATDSVGNVESKSLTTTDNAIARWDSTTGKVIQNSVVTINDNGQMFFPNGQNIYFRNSGNTANINSIASSGNVLYFGDASYSTIIQGLTITVSNDLNMGNYNITSVGTVDGVDVSSHAARHIAAGADEIDGDRLDIDFIGSNYNPQPYHVYSESPNHLAAHLYGIDIALGYQSDHGNLGGLADDDHTQYLLIDGTRAMTGDLNMGSNDVFSVGSVGAASNQARLAFASTSYTFYTGSSDTIYYESDAWKMEDARSPTVSSYSDLWNYGGAKFYNGGSYYSLSKLNGNGNCIVQTQLNWV